MDLDFDGCMGRLQNVCHNYPVYCFLRGAVCKKPQTYRWLYFGLWMWLLKLSLVVVVVDDDDDDDLVFSALVFVCVSLCLLSCTCLFVHLSLSYPAYFFGGSMCQKSHELTRRLLSNEVTSSSPRHPYRCISVGFQQGWDDHSTSTRMKRATVVNLRLLEMPGNVDSKFGSKVGDFLIYTCFGTGSNCMMHGRWCNGRHGKTQVHVVCVWHTPSTEASNTCKHITKSYGFKQRFWWILFTAIALDTSCTELHLFSFLSQPWKGSPGGVM